MDMDISMIDDEEKEEEKDEEVEEDEDEEEEVTWRDCVCLVANSSSKLSMAVSRGFISTEVCRTIVEKHVVRDMSFNKHLIFSFILTKLCPMASSSARLSS